MEEKKEKGPFFGIKREGGERRAPAGPLRPRGWTNWEIALLGNFDIKSENSGGGQEGQVGAKRQGKNENLNKQTTNKPCRCF